MLILAQHFLLFVYFQLYVPMKTQTTINKVFISECNGNRTQEEIEINKMRQSVFGLVCAQIIPIDTLSKNANSKILIYIQLFSSFCLVSVLLCHKKQTTINKVFISDCNR